MVHVCCRGGLPLALRTGAIVTAVLASACLAGQQGDSSSPPPPAQSASTLAARAAPTDGEGCAEGEDGLWLRPGLLQTGNTLQPAPQTGGEGHAGAGGAQAEMLQAGAQMTAEGNATLPPVATEAGREEIGVSPAASAEPPAVIGLVGRHEAVLAAVSGSSTTWIIIGVLLFICCCCPGCFCLHRLFYVGSPPAGPPPELKPEDKGDKGKSKGW